jgi:hypothetical protein
VSLQTGVTQFTSPQTYRKTADERAFPRSKDEISIAVARGSTGDDIGPTIAWMLDGCGQPLQLRQKKLKLPSNTQ